MPISKYFDIDLDIHFFTAKLARMSTSLNKQATPVLNMHEQLTRLCKASADALRLNILRVLQQNSYAVQELCDIFEVRQSSMSHHLKILSQAGLIDSKREGNTLFYRRQPNAENPQFQEYFNGLFHTTDLLIIDDKHQKTLTTIKDRRSKRSLEFFTKHAEKLHTQQDLIAEYPQYGDTVASLLDSHSTLKHGTALEIGPGEGQFLPELAQRFERVMALDNNQAILHTAQNNLRKYNFTNIEWLHGDTQDARIQAIGADLIVLNMVLHHTPSPAAIFADLAHCIASDGTLIITDLCRHTQDWASTNCGDLWLGFDTEELVSWAHNAGFAKHQTLYLSLLNGFRIQICLFTLNN